MQACFRTSCISFCLLFSCFATDAFGAKWALDPKVAFRTGYDDNLTLRNDESSLDKIDTWENVLTAGLTFGRETEINSLKGTFQAAGKQYPGNSDLNVVDWLFNVRGTQSTERNLFGLGLDYIKDTTLDSELEDTGQVNFRRKRHRFLIEPNWSYALTERSNVGLNLYFNKTNYKNKQNTGLNDYKAYNIEGFYDIQHTAKNLWSVRARYGQLKRDNSTAKYKNYGGDVGLVRTFTERFTGTFHAGVRHTRSEFKQAEVCPVDPIFVDVGGGEAIAVCPVPLETVTTNQNDTGGVFDVKLDYKYETGHIFADARQGLVPSGSAGVLNNTTVRVGGDMGLATNWRGFLTLRWSKNQSVNNVSKQTADRTYIEVKPVVRWNFARDWSADLWYRHRRQNYDNAPGKSVSNSVFVSVTYGWPEIVLLRN
jgi:hypothetical protein